MSGLSFLAGICLSVISVTIAEISCRNEAGDPVDWFVLYKLPMFQINKSAGSGLDYLYLDSKMQGWQLSKLQINMTESAVGQVLQQLYQTYNKNDTAYMMYNDAHPQDGNYTTKQGHTKGFLLLDKTQGFWLIHSVPHFPPFPENGYGYPSTGRLYGQTAICVTYKYDQFKEIGSQLLYYNPPVYNCSIPDMYKKELWSLNTICTGSRFPWIEQKRLIPLESAQGEQFLNFAKSKYYIDDIYTAWIAQQLKTNLLAESWKPKNTYLPSNCSLQYHVYNIKQIDLPMRSSFCSHYDHSKWCVSQTYKDQWTCIGDLNRYPYQIFRSGGFICTQNKIIYNAFRKMVADCYNCTSS
ncbi:deoxyribonuclease-2-beta [Bombina bombina]|uniref:deoxyribonuclease-2-beta n=1 Tax=Bombina bombina TaxID=8345 RepID=UPI00235A8086|nr:deoxyribonuclease-2-beta [Bombina bombina]